MESLRLYTESEFEKSLLLSVKDLRGNIFHGQSAPEEFSLQGTTIASFYIEGGRAAIAVSDGKVSSNQVLQAASLEFKKLIEIDRVTVMAISGSAGFALLYAKILKNWVETTERIREEKLSVRAKVNMVTKILRESLSLSMGGFVVQPIITTYDKGHGPRIFLFTPDGSEVPRNDYAIAGSGKSNEGGLLTNWREDLSREEGIKLAQQLVINAHKLDKATGGRIFIKIIDQSGIESIDGGFVND